MLTHGDGESINLGTDEHHRRVTGNGEWQIESLGISGLKLVNPADLAEYERVMREEGISEILEAVAMRQRLASEARQRVMVSK